MPVSSSAIGVSVHKFDLLVLLSRRPSNMSTTEQPCSIFFRLLRQNALSKKKSSEHELTCPILKCRRARSTMFPIPWRNILSSMPFIFKVRMIRRMEKVKESLKSDSTVERQRRTPRSTNNSNQRSSKAKVTRNWKRCFGVVESR